MSFSICSFGGAMTKNNIYINSIHISLENELSWLKSHFLKAISFKPFKIVNSVLRLEYISQSKL